jgi:hypothetical protein
MTGRATVRNFLAVWLDEQKHSVSAKTYTADAALPRLVPTALGALSINAGDRSRDHTGVDHPYEKWLGRVVGASFPRLAIVVLCLGSARADDRPGHDH